MTRRVLFLIRTKLGDTLATYAGVRAFVDANPGWEVTLLVRRNYVPLLEGEPGVRVLGFRGRLDLLLRLLPERLSGRHYDVLAVAWGQGPTVRWLARLVSAKRRIHFQKGRHEDLFREAPDMPPEQDLFDPGWRVARMVAADFPKPEELRLPSLRRRREALAGRQGEAVGVVPFADELRRNLDAATLQRLLEAVALRHPGAEIRLFVNPSDPGSDIVRGMSLPAGARIVPFPELPQLVESYCSLTHWYGTDTGLFHLAAGMGIPATVFFGPTQPWKVVRPAQPGTRAIRLKVLGREHCEVKSCARPVCLHQAVATWAAAPPVAMEDAPAQCPLRGHPAEALPAVGEA